MFVMGMVSFFNDFASEMIYPIVPIFLTAVLGAPVDVVGLIEGIAESTASLMKVASGWLSDKFKKRKLFVVAGYSLSTVGKVILGLAVLWPMVLLARFVDRLGKGIRGAPRDALIVESTPADSRGKAFGFHRALDTLGAVVGPLAAIALMELFHQQYQQYRLIFLIAAIPSVIGVVLLCLYVKEIKSEGKHEAVFKVNWRELDPSFKIFLLISVVFAVGNSSDAFLILRAKNLGLSVIMTVFAYVLFNVTYSLLSTPAGIISDKIGARKVLFIGFLLFAVVYLFFGLAKSGVWIWVLFPVYGIYMALTEGVARSYIAGMVRSEITGTAFGVYQMVLGVCTFFASLIAGLLWERVAVGAPFIFGAVMAVLAAGLFFVLQKRLKAVTS